MIDLKELYHVLDYRLHFNNKCNFFIYIGDNYTFPHQLDFYLFRKEEPLIKTNIQYTFILKKND